jgi:type IX secretion system PorP/SprF family membrane protein
MIMRTALFTGVLISLLTGNLLAQQEAQTSQYMLNQYIFNPAVGGTSENIEAAAGYRAQWIGLEGAPQTFYATVHGALGNKPAGKKKKKTYFHGVGAYFSVDKTGLLSRTLAYFSYAYNMSLTKKIRLSTGLFAGIQQQRIDGSKVVMNGSDNSLPPTNITQIMPDVSLGTWLYSEDFYAGVSINQILKNRLDYSINNPGAQEVGSLQYHFFITGGYRFAFGSDEAFEWIPSAMVRIVSPAPVSFDINNKIRYKKMCWAGVSYRHQDAIAFLAGFTVAKSLHIGYSYDVSTSGLAAYNNNTHEILVGYSFGNKNSSTKGSPGFW